MIKRKVLSLFLALLMVLVPIVASMTVSAANIYYKIKVDGKEVTVGRYAEGATVTLPTQSAPSGKVFVGYKNPSGEVVTEATATSQVIEYTTVYRKLPTGDYINERGNLANLKAKLESGKLNIVFLGGSVTVGVGGGKRWGTRITNYLREQYPNATINEMNVGIGGTGSRLGSFRLYKDVIEKDPDLVFVDFMLNDSYNADYAGNTYRAGKNYEYIMRTLRKELPDAEIITLFITDDTSASSFGYETVHPIGVEQDKIAANYDVTSIDVGRYMLESIFEENKYFDQDIWDIYVSDYVHPGANGHAVYAEVIKSYLAGIKTTTGTAKNHTVPDTYAYPTAEGYYTEMIPLTLNGSTINPALKNVKGFTLQTAGSTAAFPYKLVPASEASFEFEFTGTELSLYMNNPNKESSVSVTIDGVTKTQTGKGDTNGPKEFFDKLENTKHTAKVELSGITESGNILGILVGVDTLDRSDVDPSTIDCIIKTAEDIVNDGTITSLIDDPKVANSIVGPGKVELKGLVDGMARFGVKSSLVGQTWGTSDRLLVKLDDVVFSDYQYCVMVYKTNIEAPTLNFNMTTKDAEPASNGDYKLYFPQSRIVNELATGVAPMKLTFTTGGKITGIYVPIFNTATDTKMSADDYFDIQYIGFFKNGDDAELFDYERYIAKSAGPGDVDGNGKIEAIDVVKLTRALANWEGYEDAIDPTISDFDANGNVTLVDVIYLARHIAGWKGYEDLYSFGK